MWSQETVKGCQNRLLGVCFLILSIISLSACGERETILTIVQPTEVHAITQAVTTSAPNMNVQPGKVIATLKSGETAKAIGVYHGQDHDGFQVRLPDGTEGIIIASDSFTVTSR